MSVSCKQFFSFTRALDERAGKFSTFMWGCYGGLWKSCASAKVLSKLADPPDWDKIEEHLFEGAPERGGVDLLDLCESPWTEHQAAFSELVLTQSAVLYEEWCKSMSTITSVHGKKIKPESFQFPSSSGVSSKWDNWSILDTHGLLARSSFLTSEVQPGLLLRYEKGIRNIDALLRWYRFFKELRNCFVHSGGIGSSTCETAFIGASATSLMSLGVGRNYVGTSPAVGRKLVVSLSDSILVMSVVQRLARAFDAKYCNSNLAESDLRARVAAALAANPPKTRMSSLDRKRRWMNSFLGTYFGFSVGQTSTVAAWMESTFPEVAQIVISR